MCITSFLSAFGFKKHICRLQETIVTQRFPFQDLTSHSLRWTSSFSSLWSALCSCLSGASLHSLFTLNSPSPEASKDNSRKDTKDYSLCETHTHTQSLEKRLFCKKRNGNGTLRMKQEVATLKVIMITASVPCRSHWNELFFHRLQWEKKVRKGCNPSCRMLLTHNLPLNRDSA